MTPLAICHVLWSVEIGGAERVVLDLAKVQRAAGHRVAVLTFSNPNGALAGEFGRVVDILESVPKRARGIDLTLPLRLARWFRAHRTQVVHTHNELPLIYGAPGGRIAGAVVVHSKHGVVPVSRGAHWLRRAAARACDVFVAVSDRHGGHGAREPRVCAPDKLRVVINGTDLSRFPAPHGARARSDASWASLPRPGCSSRSDGWSRRRITPLLLRAVAAAPSRRPAPGHRGRRLAARRAARHRAGARRTAASCTSLEPAATSPPFSRLPTPSSSRRTAKGSRSGLLEAWAAGLPVVSTAVGGIPEAVRPDETGLLVPPGDEAALTAALRRVFDGDDVSRTHGGAWARARARYLLGRAHGERLLLALRGVPPHLTRRWMRVLFYSSIFPRAVEHDAWNLLLPRVPGAGAARARGARRLAAELFERAARGPEAAAGPVRAEGRVPALRLPASHPAERIRPVHGPLQPHTMARVMAELRPDCMLSYWAHPDGAVAAQFARAARIPSGVIVGGIRRARPRAAPGPTTTQRRPRAPRQRRRSSRSADSSPTRSKRSGFRREGPRGLPGRRRRRCSRQALRPRRGRGSAFRKPGRSSSRSEACCP